jgi:hypothetical protein
VYPSPKFTACFTLSMTQAVRRMRFFVNAVLPPDSDVNGAAQRPVFCRCQGSFGRRDRVLSSSSNQYRLLTTCQSTARVSKNTGDRSKRMKLFRNRSSSVHSIAWENMVTGWNAFGSFQQLPRSFPGPFLTSKYFTRFIAHLNISNHDCLHTVEGASC